MMPMPSMIRVGVNISRPRMTIMPTPFFSPTISAASTAIQAAKKLMRSLVNICGRTAGTITHAHPRRRGREEVDAQHGDPLRQHRRENHPGPHLRARGAEGARGLDQSLVD